MSMKSHRCNPNPKLNPSLNPNPKFNLNPNPNPTLNPWENWAVSVPAVLGCRAHVTVMLWADAAVTADISRASM